MINPVISSPNPNLLRNIESSFCDIGPMGYTLKDIDLVSLTERDLTTIRGALLKHGVIVSRNQNMSRKKQIDFTERLGQLIHLPKFLNVKDPEEGFEERILRVTDYDSKGLPKEQKDLNGQYWHKDGEFMQIDYVASIFLC